LLNSNYTNQKSSSTITLKTVINYKFYWSNSGHYTSDVARPLSYKTKTTFSRPRPLLLKTIKLLTQDHWRSQKFWLGGAQIGKILVTFLRDVMVITSWKWRHNYILKFDFVIISFKNHYLAKSQKFKSPILKIKRRWRRKAPGAWRFLKICY